MLHDGIVRNSEEPRPSEIAHARWTQLNIKIAPTIDLVRRSLLRIADHGIPMSRTSRDETDRHFLKLLDNFEKAIRDFDSLTFGGSKLHLDRLVERTARILNAFSDAPEWVGKNGTLPIAKDWTDQLMKDLRIWEWLEVGGLEKVNSELADALQALKEAPPMGGAEAVEQLNFILYRALYTLPNTVRGVRITLHLDNVRASGVFGRFLETDHIGRDQLISLVKHGQKVGENKYSFVLPLPYRRESEDHEFMAARYSMNDLEFDAGATQLRRDIRGVTFSNMNQALARMPPHLRILSHRWTNLQPLWSFITPQEISSIEFTTDDEYVPFQIQHINEAKTIEARNRPNWVQHYLEFRDFARLDTKSKSELLREVPKLAGQRILIPGYSSNLINIGEEDNGTQFLECGYWYVATPASHPNNMRLYRFSDICIAPQASPTVLKETSALQIELYRALVTPEHPLRHHLKVFEGLNVVRQLMRIPVELKLFDD